MSSELSLSLAEISFILGGLARSTAEARIRESSASRSSVVRLSGGGAKLTLVSGMAGEPQDLFCPVVAAMRKGFQVKTTGCRGSSRMSESIGMRMSVGNC
jgi:hypothetical protein